MNPSDVKRPLFYSIYGSRYYLEVHELSFSLSKFRSEGELSVSPYS